MSNLQFARDESGNRIIPSPKGRGFCPVCEGTMIAKCGEIYRWHWQHVRDSNCDSWKEHETIWHRTWKEKFPPEWREVIIELDGEKHIADVLTGSGTVIEFQNSPISVSTISIRETFYDNMLWVINARSFSDNFSIRSTVTQKLRKLDESFAFDKKPSYDPDWNLADFNRKFKSLQHERDIHKRNMEHGQRILAELEKVLDGLVELVTKVRNSWDSYLPNQFYIHGLSSLADSLKADYIDKTCKISAVKKDLDESVKRVKGINDMEIYHYADAKFIIADFKDLKPELIDRCIIISKADKDTIFPTVLKFRSEADFFSYQYKTAAYFFAINPQQTLERLNGDIERLQQEYAKLNLELPDYIELLIYRFTEFLQNELKLNETRYYSASEKEMEAQSKIYTLEIEREEYKDELAEEQSRSEKDDKLKYEAEKSRIMKTHKGRYSFVWKRERKSWSETVCPVYFDIGKDYLFERTGAGSLIKVSIVEFLNRHLKST